MESTLRVVQLNIGSLLEPDWDIRRLEISHWLDELAPDVVCLQEVWESPRDENTARWLSRHLATPMEWTFGGFSFAESLWPDGDTRFGEIAFGSAVLSRWPIETTETHRLPVVEDGSMVTGIPFELVHARTAGLDIFSTHIAPAPSDGHHRTIQVPEIDRIIQAACPPAVVSGFGKRRPGMPPILCGDFNSESDSDEMRFLAGLTMLEGRTTFYQDAWRVAGTGAGYTQDWRDNEIAAGLNVHRKRIDYVWVGDPFLRAGSAGRVLSASLAFHEQRTGIVASDHRGLVVDVVWPYRPPTRVA